MNYINNLGEFDSLADVWKEYPHGGKEGDYVVINGVNVAWNKYTTNWGADTEMPDVNNEVNGDFLVKRDLRVGGEIINKDLKWIKEATVLNKGYFKTVDDLKRSYPAATAGSKAYVGVTYPFAIYLWDATTSAWVDSGEIGGEESVDLGDYYTKEEADSKFANIIEEQQQEIAEFKEAVTDQVENYKPIVINGDVANAADEEDITSDNGLLKLANRSAINGMGYVILRKDKTFAEQVIKANTIYEIRYDFDLNGAEITIPEGCVLDFQGGSLNDGIIFCNNTKINSNIKCFNNIILKNNSWSNVIWWGAKGNKKEDSTKAFQDASHNIKESGTLFIPAGEYFISDTIEIIDIHIKCEGKIFSDILGEKQSVFRISKSEEGAKWLNRLNIDGLKIECSKRNELGFGNGIALDIDTYFVSVSHCDIRFYNYGYLIRGWDVTLFESLSYGCKTNIAAASKSFNNLNIIGGTHTDAHRASIYLGDPEIGFEGTYGGGRDVVISGIACDGGVIILDSITAATISNCYFERVNTKKQLTIKGDCKNVSILNNHFNACTYGIYIDDESSVQGLVINNNYFINILGVAICLGQSCSQVNIKYNYYHSSSKLLQKVYVPFYPNYTLVEYREISKERYKDIEVDSWDYKSKYKVFGGNLLLKDDEVFKIQYFGALYLDNYEIIEKTFNIENCICTPIDSDALYYYNGGDFIIVGGKLGYISSIDFENNTMTLSNHFKSIKGQYIISPNRPTLKLLYKNNIETSESNPPTDNLRKGDYLFNTNQNIPMFWDGKLWRDASGEKIDTNNKYGTFSQKPASSKEGYAYFCTDRQTQEGATDGIMIYHKGNNIWVDALGRIIR